jgi:hypothetical protein
MNFSRIIDPALTPAFLTPPSGGSKLANYSLCLGMSTWVEKLRQFNAAKARENSGPKDSTEERKMFEE